MSYSYQRLTPGRKPSVKLTNLIKNIGLCQNKAQAQAQAQQPIPSIPFIGNGYTYSFNDDTYMIQFKNNGIIKFLNDCFITYTLVGGGGSGAAPSSFGGGQSGGGGGHVLNNTLGIIANNGNTWNITIGNGGIINDPINNGIGEDTQIQSNSSVIATTNNSLYSGGGGLGASNFSTNGGGGPGDNITSASGGNYFLWTYFSVTYGLGAGGGGGSLTSGALTTLGGNGLTADSYSIDADGGNGQQGIDGNWYGGGGGGGVQNNNPYFQSGKGGIGGGGGGYSIYTTYPINGENNTGGGGGGGSNGNLPIISSGNGGSGIVILYVKVINNSTNNSINSTNNSINSTTDFNTSCTFYEDCQCIQEKVAQIKTGYNDPTQTQAKRVSRAITGTLGGRTTFGNAGVSAIVTYLGGIEGQPGGIPRPLRNKF
jgi:hypothetical protein